MAPALVEEMSTKSLPAPPYPESQRGIQDNNDPGVGPSRQAPAQEPEGHLNCTYCAQRTHAHAHNDQAPTSDWAPELSIPMTSFGGNDETVPENRERPYPVLTTWGFEMLMMVMAIVSLVGLFIILIAVDGKIIAVWPCKGLNLETVISLMVTATVASIAYVIFQVLGQAGWSWFGHTLDKRPLYDLSVFNHGGHGILSSLRLMMSVLGSGISGLRTSAGVMAICCALVTILAFGAGPFAQQALRTVPCSFQSGPGLGSIPVSNFVPANDDHFIKYAVEYLVFDLDPEMKGVMTNALANPGAGVESALKADCPSGHCKFRDYGTGITHSTIGLCSTCIDLGAYVTDTEVAGPKLGLFVRNYSLPHDGSRDALRISGQESWGSYIVPQSTEKNPWMSLTMAGSFDYAMRGWTPEFLASARNALFNFTIIAASDAPCTIINDGVKFCPWQIGNDMVPENNFTSLVAVGCRLYPCLKNFHAEVKSGLLTEELVSTVPARTNLLEKVDGGLHVNVTALQDPCFLADQGSSKKVFTSDELSQVPPAEHRTFSRITTAHSTVVQAPSDCLYHASAVYLQAMKNHLIDLLAGRCRYTHVKDVPTIVPPPKVTCGDKWWLDPLYASRNASLASISAAMDGLAVAVTNQFRRTGSGPHRPRAEGDPTGLTVRGDAWQDTMCFSLEWKWLLLPAGLVAATLVLLGAAVLRSYMEPEQPVWKASVLPMVFYGLAGRGGGGGVDEGYARRDLMDLRKVEEVSKNLKVRFDKLGGSGFAS